MYQLDETKRNEFASMVAELFPEIKRAKVKQEARELSDLFEGQDINVFGILHRASEKERFDEFKDKLRLYHESHSIGISPYHRQLVQRMQFTKADLEYYLLRVSINRINENFPRDLLKLMYNPEAMREELFFHECYDSLKPFSS